MEDRKDVGILDRTTNPRKISEPQVWEYVLQRHLTPKGEKHRTHWDLRLGDPKTKTGHSWALPKGLPGPGEIRLAIQQPDHALWYFDFHGSILPEKYKEKYTHPSKNILFSRDAYGVGKVYKEDRGKVEILEADKDHIKFTTLHRRYQDTYLLFRNKDNQWYIKNISITAEPKRKLVESKPKFKSMDPDKLKFPTEYAVMPKLDGSYATALIEENGIRVFSHRPRERTTAPIEYTARMPQITHNKVPKELAGTVVRGEVIAYKHRDGKVIPFTATEVAQLLNSSPLKSREIQKEKGEIEYWLFDILKLGGKDISKAPYHVRRQLLEDFVAKMQKLGIDNIKLMPIALNDQEKQKLWETIEKGKYPYTKEGVVLVHPNRPNEWVKVKIRPTIDAKIVGITEGEGRLKGKGAGAFLVIPEGSKQITHVGTGIPDWLRTDAYLHPKKYIGKTVELSVLDVFPEKGNPKRIGKLRAPALKKIEGKSIKELKFERFHIEKNL